MKVLVACEESQEVCKAFRAKGHEAFSCDVVPCSGGYPEWHILDDAVNAIYSNNWDLVIAHPPCTYLCKASARFMFHPSGVLDNKRYVQAMKARKFFMDILNSPCEKICIENPTPLRVVGLPKESQVIQPYMFGDPYSKRTLLWLKNLPILEPTNICESFTPYCPSNTSAHSRGGGGSIGIEPFTDSRKRSKTFPGIAAAMANQWG